MMLYSIIIPAFNAEKTLGLCLEAVIHQSIDPDQYEIIVIDDGSTDSTEYVARQYSVRYYYQPNQGPAVARNHGAQHARGKWVIFTDADCRPAPQWLMNMGRALQAGISGAQGAYATDQAGLVPRLCQCEFQDRYALMARHADIDLVATYSAAFSRDIFLSFGGFDESFPQANNEDTEFSYRLSAKGHKLIFVPNAVVYHQHPETLGKYLRTKFWRGYWRMQVYKRYPDKAVHDKYTTLSLKLQVMAALVWYVLAVAFVLWPFLGYGLAACILYMLITSLASTGRNYSSDQKASLFIPPLYVLRALSIAAGIIFWSGHNVLKRLEKMGTVFHAREMHK